MKTKSKILNDLKNKNDIIDEKTLILLLQESPDDDFTSNFFDKIETKILKEED